MESKSMVTMSAQAETSSVPQSPNQSSSDDSDYGHPESVVGHFDGLRHGYFFGPKYYNPSAAARALREPPIQDSERTIRHRDILGRLVYEPVDVERGIDPYNGRLSRVIIQAAPAARSSDQGPWRRAKIKGHAPKRLRVADWILGRHVSAGDTPLTAGEVTIRSLKIVSVSWVLPFMSLMSFPSQSYVGSRYMGVPARSWEYPKHVRNQLDGHPNAPVTKMGKVSVDNEKVFVPFDVAKYQERLLRPRTLVVKQSSGTWEVEEHGHDDPYVPYLFISYANPQFKTDDKDEVVKKKGREELERIAQRLAEQENVSAYYLDFRCRASKQPELSDDIHRLGDVIRGSRKVWIILPSYTVEKFSQWGSRMWTLAEALLAPKQEVFVYAIEGPECHALPLHELPKLAWLQYTNPGHDIRGEVLREDREASLEDFSLLIEHFAGKTILSRLELITIALRVLRSRKFYAFQKGDRAYALMAFLQYRPAMDPTDSEFQALARLSLTNDSDRIVERMVCLLPRAGPEGLFNTEDTLHAKLHEIEPITQIAGVCNDDGLIVDGCRGISIHWDDFPTIRYMTRNTAKKRWSRRLMRFGVFTWVLAIILAAVGRTLRPFTYVYSGRSYRGRARSDQLSPMESAGVFFIFLSLAIAFVSPWLMSIVFGGKVWGMQPWLIAFEGTMPLANIERKLFGNAIGRLHYSPSGSVFSRRDPRERVGVEPDLSIPIPPGHRLFTLVDTGAKTVTIFSARFPPSVALICGKEGGMLRALLCSYDLQTKSYLRQSIVRMETPALDMSRLMSWVKMR